MMEEKQLLKSNLFVVRSEDLEIPEWLVRRVCDNPLEKNLIIEYESAVIDRKDFFAEVYFHERTSNVLKHGINVEILDATGVVLYTKHYLGCKIKRSYISDLDYRSEDSLVFSVMIEYDNIEITTRNEREQYV